MIAQRFTRVLKKGVVGGKRGPKGPGVTSLKFYDIQYRPKAGWARLYLPTKATENISECAERNTSVASHKFLDTWDEGL
jgi:hypothetical protein